MTENITRVSLTLPVELLAELDLANKSKGYASRSIAVRDALRDFLASYWWRDELKGKLLGTILAPYKHDVRGPAEALTEIQHESSIIISAAQHLRADAKKCLEILIVGGQAGAIRKLANLLSTLRGVKQTKLVVV